MIYPCFSSIFLSPNILDIGTTWINGTSYTKAKGPCSSVNRAYQFMCHQLRVVRLLGKCVGSIRHATELQISFELTGYCFCFRIETFFAVMSSLGFTDPLMFLCGAHIQENLSSHQENNTITLYALTL